MSFDGHTWMVLGQKNDYVYNKSEVFSLFVFGDLGLLICIASQTANLKNITLDCLKIVVMIAMWHGVARPLESRFCLALCVGEGPIMTAAIQQELVTRRTFCKMYGQQSSLQRGDGRRYMWPNRSKQGKQNNVQNFYENSACFFCDSPPFSPWKKLIDIA